VDESKPKAIIAEAMAQGRPLLFHNAKFDTSVMREYWGMVPRAVDDTLFLIFLDDPYASTFSLKPSAQRILGIAPEEQDALRDWILGHVPGSTPKNFGAFISKAPADIVGPYANGDVDRTWKLYERIRPRIPSEAYERELKLLPIVMESERRGVRLDEDKLADDLRRWDTALEKCDAEIHGILGNKHVNIDSGTELADALEAKGLVSEWQLTPTGKRSTARAALEKSIAHPGLLALLQYRGALSHCLSNFARPWLRIARCGRLHPEWNQVRQARENTSDSKGTRTGRLSCTNPNFQNPPNEYDILPPGGYPSLPLMRQYLLPDKGFVWCKRDYSQQEMRILAHYSEGRLYHRYRENPRIDAHVEAHSLIQKYSGLDLVRKYVKITGFSIVYGSGIPALAGMLGVPVPEAAQIKGAYLFALPEVRELMDECKLRGRNNEPIVTWGGREYYVEPPYLDPKTNRMRTFEYKLLNYLIQGSAADCTKESIVRWGTDKGNGQFLATLHDENDMQAPKESWKKDMAKLNRAMGSIEFDVPMLSDGFVGSSWAQLKECD